MRALFVTGCVLVLTVALLLMSCGGHETSSSPGTSGQNGNDSTILQPPGSLVRTPLTVQHLAVNGDDLNTGWPHQYVSVDGTNGVYSPTGGSGLQLAEVAFATYAFNAGTNLPLPSFLLSWETPPANDSLWLAFSDWSSGSWVWHAISNPESVVLPDIANYIDGSGQMLVLVVVANQQAVLQSMRMMVDDGNSSSFSERGAWPMYGHDPQHTGCSEYVGPHTNHVAWINEPPITSSFNSYPSPIIAYDGTVYVGSSTAGIFAYNPDGSLKQSYQEFETICSPVIRSDNSVLILSPDGIGQILADGSSGWLSNYSAFCIAAPVINEYDTLFFNNTSGIELPSRSMIALGVSGSELWSLPLETPDSYPAIGHNGVIYCSDMKGSLYAITQNGETQWIYQGVIPSYKAIVSCPAIGDDGTIYVGGYDGLHAVNPDGTNKWVAEFICNKSTPAIGPDGTIYIGSNSDEGINKPKLYAIDPAGSIKWYFNSYGAVYSSPTVGADGVVYFCDAHNVYYGNIYAMQTDGNLLWQSDSDSFDQYTTPAIGSDGTLYAIGNGGLCAFRDE